jgi:hypothetical protein
MALGAAFVVVLGTALSPIKPSDSSAGMVATAPARSTSTSAAETATVASAADRTAAVQILTASVTHYRDEFLQGQAIIGHTQYASGTDGLTALYDDPTSAAARFRDYRQNPGPERDLSGDTAFKQAGSVFAPGNEPQAIRDWKNDLTHMTSDLNRWVSVAANYQIQRKTQADLDAAAAKVEQDLAKLDADANAVGKG